MWKNLTLEKSGSTKSTIFSNNSRVKAFIPYIVISSLLTCTALYYVEWGQEATYLIKTGIKLLLFLLIPTIYYIFTRDTNIYISSSTKPKRRGSLLPGFLIGLLSFAVLMAAYYFLQTFIDFKTIIMELETRLKVNPMNFLFVGIYITLFNSFIEEFFFRGFVFLGIYRAGKPGMAYFYSSLLFALYHIMIFRNWFTLPLFFIALFGLFVVGLFYNWLDTKSKNFISSWIAHIFANAAIILIGLKMFGIINF